MEHIIVGTDLSPRSQVAVDHAADLAEAMGATLHLVCACRTPTVGVGDSVMPMPDHGAYLESMQVGLDAVVARLGPRGLVVESHLPAGDAADGLCRVAKAVEADVIVVGNKRVKGASRVLGSVAKSVLHHADCHVLISDTGAERAS